jgi:hypothetical protein
MTLKALALCAVLGASTVALALPAQSAITRLSASPVLHNDSVATDHYADASGNTDGYRSGSDNANIATYQPSDNPDAYSAGSNNAGLKTFS